MAQRQLIPVAQAHSSQVLAAHDEDTSHDSTEPLVDVSGVIPFAREKKPQGFIWCVDHGARKNYTRLGQRLAVVGDLYRDEATGHGLVLVRPDGTSRHIGKGSQLAPLIVDRVSMRVVKEGKVVSELPTAAHLNAMLHAKAFLDQFQPVNEVTRTFFYAEGFVPLRPGYNDFGPGNRILFLGEAPSLARSTETIRRFLRAMPFASEADATNTVAAALTVLFRRQWLGEKPLVQVTSTRSHSGKGTVTEFLRGVVPKADILYEAQDWPMQSQFQRQVRLDADIGLVVFDNVRLDSAGGRATMIRSAFLESFVTSPEVTLASPGAGEALRVENKYVVTLNTNDGALSPDLMNRSLPIHLAPVGDVQDRPCDIGNPKLEFLPQNRERIEAELNGMVQRWIEAGSPLDTDVRYPMIGWARTVGGILKVNGFEGFLANYGSRKSHDDPIRDAISILAVATEPGKALRPMTWANLAVEQGLAKILFSANERDTPKGRERAIGRILTKNLEVVFEAQTDTKRYRLKLEGGFRRWVEGGNPHTRYRFWVLSGEDRPVDGETIQ